MDKINDELRLAIFNEDNADVAIDKLIEVSDYYLLPNISDTRAILQRCHITYIECGLWIIADNNHVDSSSRFYRYDIENSCFDALEKSDLIIYYGYGIKFSTSYLALKTKEK